MIIFVIHNVFLVSMLTIKRENAKIVLTIVIPVIQTTIVFLAIVRMISDLSTLSLKDVLLYRVTLITKSQFLPSALLVVIPAFPLLNAAIVFKTIISEQTIFVTLTVYLGSIQTQ